MLVDIEKTFPSFFFKHFQKSLEFPPGNLTAKLATIFLCKKFFCTKRRIHELIMKIWTRPALRLKKNPFSNAIIFEKNFELHIHPRIWTSFLRPAIAWPSDSHDKFQTFLKVFEKNDEKVILMSTNIIIGQLNIKDYEYDDGVTIFWLCENLQAHFHFRLFDP